MHKYKRTSLALLSVSALLVLLFSVAILPAKTVSAAAAKCYSRSLVGDAPFKSENCDTWKSVIEMWHGTLSEDTCYLINGDPLSQPTKAAADSAECKSWTLRDLSTGFSAPTCYSVDANATDELASTDYTTAECTPEIAEKIRQNGFVFDEFKPGFCYIIYNNSYSFEDCKTTEQRFASLQEQELNPDREAVTNCDGRANGGNPQECFETNPIVRLILQFINFLSIGIGVIVTIVIIVGGIQYMTAGPNPQAVSAAKKRITNAILALLAYFLLFAFLQWVVPGGIL